MLAIIPLLPAIPGSAIENITLNNIRIVNCVAALKQGEYTGDPLKVARAGKGIPGAGQVERICPAPAYSSGIVNRHRAARRYALVRSLQIPSRL